MMIVEHTENNLRIIEYNRVRYGSDFAAGMSKAFLIASEELSAERERAEYAEKVGYETSRKNADLMVKLSAELEAHKKEIELILSAVARGENIANSLNFDGRSELQKERERAWKLVEAAKYVLLFAEKDGWIVNGYRSKECVLELQQTLNEYDTATKEPGSH